MKDEAYPTPPLTPTPWSKRLFTVWLVAALWVAGISWVVAWFRLGGIGLIDETEPLFAEASRQMVVTSDWITPYFNEAPRFDKPPLVYWLMAWAYQTVGVTEWSVRFPSALAITVLVGLGFHTLWRFGSPSQSIPAARLSAFIGSAAIALNIQTFLWGRTGVSDMLLNGCMGAALLSFFCAYAQPEHPKRQGYWYVAFYLFLALAVLTKGPVGVVLPGLIILAFLLYTGNFRPVWRELRPLPGSLLFLLVTVPWFVLVIVANGQSYIDSFFGYHNLERFTSVVNRHSAPWFFYFLVVPISFLPWSAHLPIALVQSQFWRWRDWQQQPRSTHLGIFALIWFLVIFGFFTIAVTKLPSYTIPLLPAAGLLVGMHWGDQMVEGRSGRLTRLSHWLNILLLAGLAFAAFYSPHWLGNDPEIPDLPQLLQQSGLMVWAVGSWAIAAVIGILLLLRRQGHWLWAVNLLAFALFVLTTLIPVAVIVDSQRQLPLRELAQTIVEVQKPNEPIAMVGFSKPSLVFYTQRPINYFPDIDQARRDVRRLAHRAADESGSLLLIGRTVKLEEARLTPAPEQVIDRAGIYELARIQTADLRPRPKGG